MAAAWVLAMAAQILCASGLTLRAGPVHFHPASHLAEVLGSQSTAVTCASGPPHAGIRQ